MDLTSRPEVKEVFKKIVKRCDDLHALYSKSAYREDKVAESGSARETYSQKPVKRDVGGWEGSSNVCLPLTTITVDNLEPRIVAGLIGKEPYILFEVTGM
jgi:hypothetical protein